MFIRRIVAVRLLAATILFFSGSAIAQIAGTDHDFSADGWNASGEICVVCHTPHNSDTTVAAEAPLWNHELSTATYTMYQRPLSGALDTEPAPLSKLCLSCHDGTIAVDSFGGATGTTVLTGGAVLGTDLSNDHPISVDYTTTSAAADGGLHDPATGTVPVAGSPTISDYLLDGGAKVECSSCHDVHNKYGQAALLKVDNAASNLCLTCHDK